VQFFGCGGRFPAGSITSGYFTRSISRLPVVHAEFSRRDFAMIAMPVSFPEIPMFVIPAPNLASKLAIPIVRTPLQSLPPSRLVFVEGDDHVADARDALRPSEAVQLKLQLAMRKSPVSVSSLHGLRNVRRP
jgi:hypothetical protein